MSLIITFATIATGETIKTYFLSVMFANFIVATFIAIKTFAMYSRKMNGIAKTANKPYRLVFKYSRKIPNILKSSQKRNSKNHRTK